MKVIGLCGGSGSGKSTVCSLFAELGVPSIDTDKLYHDMISTDTECTRELLAAFGEQVHAHAQEEYCFIQTCRVLNLVTQLSVTSRFKHFVLSEASPVLQAVGSP